MLLLLFPPIAFAFQAEWVPAGSVYPTRIQSQWAMGKKINQVMVGAEEINIDMLRH